MFLVIYEDYGKEPQYLGTATSKHAALACISKHFGIDPDGEPLTEGDLEPRDNDAVAWNIGDAEYVIHPLVHWS